MMLTEYEIKLKYSIPNESQQSRSSIQHKNLESKYKCSVFQRWIWAYLLADIHNWEKLIFARLIPEFILTAIISELQSWIRMLQ